MDAGSAHAGSSATNARPDEEALVAESADPTPVGPASWAQGLLAVCLSAVAGAGLVSIWLALAPPKAFGNTSIVISTVVLLAIVGLLVISQRAQTAGRNFAALALAVLWSCLLIGWLLVFPGVGWIAGVFIFGAAAVRRIRRLTDVLRGKVRRWRFDPLAGSLVAVTTIAVVVAAWSPLLELGLRFRLSLVQDRYEQAIAANEVEETDGFVEGELSGWVWIDQIVLDPAAGVVFDPSDSWRSALTPSQSGSKPSAS